MNFRTWYLQGWRVLEHLISTGKAHTGGLGFRGSLWNSDTYVFWHTYMLWGVHKMYPQWGNITFFITRSKSNSFVACSFKKSRSNVAEAGSRKLQALRRMFIRLPCLLALSASIPPLLSVSIKIPLK